MPTWLVVQRSKAVFLLTLYDSINDMKQFQINSITPQPCHSHFVVDCCQLVPNLMFGLKMELMACSELVGGTIDQICHIPDLI